jgi:multidrug efflux system membrane fusion protein
MNIRLVHSTRPCRRKLARTVTLLGALLAVPVLITGCKKKAEAAADAPAPVPVYVKNAEARQIPLFVEAFGTLEAYRSVTLSPQVSGLLRAVEFTEGSTVKQGQVLYRIEPDTYQQTLDKATAALAMQRSALGPVRDRLARSKTLNQDKLLAPQDYESMQAAVTQAEANITAAESDLAQAKLNLARTTITAPMDGVIGLNSQHAGNLLSAQQTLLATIKQIDPIYVVFSIPGPTLPQLLQASRAGKVVVQACRADDFMSAPVITGELEAIDNSIDTKVDMVTLKAKLPNADQMLWPGQYLRVRLVLREMPNTTVVDAGAVMIGTEGPYIYVVQGGTVALRNVVIGEQDDDVVVVTSGVKPGEAVVVQGQLNLKNGTTVRVVPHRETAAARPAPAK